MPARSSISKYARHHAESLTTARIHQRILLINIPATYYQNWGEGGQAEAPEAPCHSSKEPVGRGTCVLDKGQAAVEDRKVAARDRWVAREGN